MSPPGFHDVTHALQRIRSYADIEGSELNLLNHVVTQTLEGATEELTQKSLAANVFRRNIDTFDGHSDSIVRTTASKLRSSLFRYYGGKGKNDPVVIELPTGSYIPRFTWRQRLSDKNTWALWSARTALGRRTVSGYKVALARLNEVLEESPDMPFVLALKAEALASFAIHGARPRPNLEEARRLAERAIGQPVTVWQAWLARAIVQQALDWDWKGAEQSYRKAIQMSDGEAATHIWYAAFLVGRGKPEEAVACVRRAADSNGGETVVSDLCMLLILSGQYDAARFALAAAIEASPDYYQNHLHYAILKEACDDPEGALRMLREAPLTLLQRPVTWGLEAMFAGRCGDRILPRRRLRWLTVISKAHYVPPSQLAACHLGIGDEGEAVRHLNRAAEERDPLLVWFHAYPFFRQLRGNAGFEALIDRVGLIRY